MYKYITSSRSILPSLCHSLPEQMHTLPVLCQFQPAWHALAKIFTTVRACVTTTLSKGGTRINKNSEFLKVTLSDICTLYLFMGNSFFCCYFLGFCSTLDELFTMNFVIADNFTDTVKKQKNNSTTHYQHGANQCKLFHRYEVTSPQ